jgi:hypothetical protein
MPRVGFESTIPAFELTKVVHALDHTATVIGPLLIALQNFILLLPLLITGHPILFPPHSHAILPCFPISLHIFKILVTIDGVWIDNRIYMTLYTQHFTGHSHTKTGVLSHGLHCVAW